MNWQQKIFEESVVFWIEESKEYSEYWLKILKKKKILTISSQYQRNKLGKMYMKNDFSIVIFSDECRATLDLMLRCYREIVFQYKRKKWGHSVMF